MHKSFIIAILFFLFVSCNKRSMVLSDHSRYERASAEIENSSYSYSQQECNGTGARVSIQEQTLSRSDFAVRRVIHEGTEKTIHYRQHKILRDTIVQDEENYQRSNRIANPNANTALVLGLLALIPIPILGILGLVAMGFGIKALNEMKREPLKYKGKGKAIFGVTIGSIIILGLIIVIIIAASGA